MANYENRYTKPYPDGYIDKPVMTTPVTAKILNNIDAVLAALEEFLTSDEVGFKKGLTVGSRGYGTIGNYSLVVGVGTAAGEGSIATGAANASGKYSAATGTGAATADLAHAEGYGTTASGNNGAHAEGQGSVASGTTSHAEGMYTKASAVYAHAEGAQSTASGTGAHAENLSTTASGTGAHAEGQWTIASGNFQHVQGQFNVEDTENLYAHIIGGGTSSERKNIHTVDWQGNAYYAGDVVNGNGISLDGLMALIATTGQLRTIVTELPTEDISTETIYMVPKDLTGENDIYAEYINLDGTEDGWEFIGTSAIDLTDYYTKTEIDALLAGYVAAASGMGLSSNDYTNEDKALVDSIKNMTVEDALAILNANSSDEEVA